MSEPREFLIRVGVRRAYGDHEIYYEISEQIEVSGGEERRSAFLNLQAQLDDQVKVYEEVSLPHVKLPNGAKNTQNTSVVVNTFPIELIKIEFADGKRRIRACGGKYLRYGVPVYPECPSSYDVNAMDYGEHDVKSMNLQATIEVENDKPMRVITIK